MSHTPNDPAGDPVGGERWPASAPHSPTWSRPVPTTGRQDLDRGLRVEPAPQRRRRGLWRTLTAVGLVVAFLIGLAVPRGDSPSSGPQSAQTPAAVTGTRSTAPAAASATTSRPATPAPTGPRTTFGNGTWEVGRDIAAGTYVTDVPADSVGCYWETDRDNAGTLDSIIANDNVSPSGRGSLATGKAKWVKVTGGCTWRKR